MSNKEEKYQIEQKKYMKNEYAKMWTQMRKKEYKFDEYDQFLISLLEKELSKKKLKILEIGCGDGNPFAKKLIPKCDYYGIDISEYLINLGKNNYGEKYFEVLDAEKIELNENYDLIFCFHSFWYLQNYLKVITNMKNLLRPNGFLVFDALNLSNLNNYREYKKILFESKGIGKFIRYVKNLVKIIFRRGYTKWSDSIHHAPNDIKKIIELIDLNNIFQSIEVYGLIPETNLITSIDHKQLDNLKKFSKIIFKCKKN